MITDLRLRSVGAGLSVADPLLSLSAVTTAGTLAVPVSLPLPSSTPRTARPELSPLTPACHTEVITQVRSGQVSLTSTTAREFTAVVLLVEVGSELFTVIAATHQTSPAAPVSVVSSAVSRAVTVALADITGTVRTAAPPALVIPPAALLAWRRLLPDPSCHHWSRGWRGRFRSGGRPLAAVVLRVIVETKLEAVVGAAHQTSSTTSVSVMSSSVTRAVTVSLPLLARILRSAAPPPSVVPPGAPLTRRRLQWQPGRQSQAGALLGE